MSDDENPQPMTDRQQCNAFANDLNALIQRYENEFELPLMMAVGVLEASKMLLIANAFNWGQPKQPPE